MKVYIYALVDPRSTKIKYIGRTKCLIEKRFGEHISKAKLRYDNTNKSKWIRGLAKEGLKSLVRKLTSIDGWSNSHAFERKLVAKYKDRLLNHDDRGEGGLNHIVSEETKRKLSKIIKEGFDSGKIAKAYNKKVHVYNLNGDYLETFVSHKIASKKLGITYSALYKCTKGVVKQCAGYRFTHTKYDKLEPLIKKPKINYYEMKYNK